MHSASLVFRGRGGRARRRHGSVCRVAGAVRAAFASRAPRRCLALCFVSTHGLRRPQAVLSAANQTSERLAAKGRSSQRGVVSAAPCRIFLHFGLPFIKPFRTLRLPASPRRTVRWVRAVSACTCSPPSLQKLRGPPPSRHVRRSLLAVSSRWPSSAKGRPLALFALLFNPSLCGAQNRGCCFSFHEDALAFSVFTAHRYRFPDDTRNAGVVLAARLA
ncbi:hypothetical protein TRVL_02016 [Trypanosoma vivax]|nr:hypothetical protein TRVL_02016 [Trypanosoma vivax]